MSRRHTKKTIRIMTTAMLFVAGAVIAGPLTYSEQAHLALDAAAHEWSAWGGPLLGPDLTMPRQNLFSLVRDLTHAPVIVDHARIYPVYYTGFAVFITRASVLTVTDALRWLDIPLTVRQARGVGLCKPLDQMRGPVVIQPDPWQYGVASWYGPGFQGQLSASGEAFNTYDLTAAHKTLALGSLVRVVANRTGNSVIVRINDRGPYASGRVVDLSYGAKEMLGMEDLASVYLERLDPTALDASCE